MAWSFGLPELQMLLGYSKWENFEQVIAKAKIACTNSGHHVGNHFPDVRKMVEIGSGTSRAINDVALTRYACYLIAQNGDPRKDEIAFAMTYFAVQTRKQEVIEQRLAEVERRHARSCTCGFITTQTIRRNAEGALARQPVAYGSDDSLSFAFAADDR